jgi:hypothetical protein
MALKITNLSQLAEYFKVIGVTQSHNGWIFRKGCELKKMGIKELPKIAQIIGNTNLNPEGVQGSLTSLSGLPDKLDGYLSVPNHQLSSLAGAPTIIHGNFFAQDNPLTSFEGLPGKITGKFVFSWNPNLPLMKLFERDREIPNVHVVPFSKDRNTVSPAGQVDAIIQQWLPRKKFMACAAALHAAGFHNNARL